MVERLVYLGSSTQVFLRLAPGTELQALLQNDGDQGQLAQLSQGTPVHAYLASDAMRVLAGGGEVADDDEPPLASISADDGEALESTWRLGSR
jgi:hypothetical protein